MFDTLDHEIEITQGGRPTRSAQLIRFADIGIVSVGVFGVLCLLVVALE